MPSNRKAKCTTASRQPRAAKAKRYEIKPLVWKNLTNDSWWAKKFDGNVIRVRLMLNGMWDASNTDEEYYSAESAKESAEYQYQQQLRRALRECKS